MSAKTYKIETERLIIRCYMPEDAPLLKNSIDESLEHLIPWMPWAKQEPETVEKKMERLRRYRGEFDLGIDYVYGIFHKEEKIQIGSTGLHTRIGDDAREIGYWINAHYINQGYATETVKALIKVGFEIEDLQRIEIRCSPENIRSQRIPEKLGFMHEATLQRRNMDSDGNRGDVMIWTLFKEKYDKAAYENFHIKAYDVGGRMIK